MAGGSGKRLRPVTLSTSKHLLQIYNKPMIYYSLSLIMLAGIKDIILICNPHDKKAFCDLFGNGGGLGIKITYVCQFEPGGVAQGLLLAKNYLKTERFMFILGDNLCFGSGLKEKLLNACFYNQLATVFGYKVSDPKDFGVLEFDEKKRLVKITEKPKIPFSNYISTGIFVFDQKVGFAENISRSKRGELEVADVVASYISEDGISVELVGRGISWIDCGNFDSLLKAGNLIKLVEDIQGFAVADIAAIARQNNWI